MISDLNNLILLLKKGKMWMTSTIESRALQRLSEDAEFQWETPQMPAGGLRCLADTNNMTDFSLLLEISMQ